MATALFEQLDIPYFNELTAGQFDASSRFDANTPASHVAYSLAVLGSYQTQGPTNRPDILGMPEVPGVIPPDTQKDMGIDPNYKPSACGTLDFACHLNEALTSPIVIDYAKRIGLLILAAVLLVVAVVSLR